MKKMNCNIIKDILPLYLDDVVSNDTREMVEEHLENCESCRKEKTLLEQKAALPANKEVQLAEARILKNLKKQIHLKKIAVSIVSVIAAVTVTVIFYLFLTALKFYIPYSET